MCDVEVIRCVLVSTVVVVAVVVKVVVDDVFSFTAVTMVMTEGLSVMPPRAEEQVHFFTFSLSSSFFSPPFFLGFSLVSLSVDTPSLLIPISALFFKMCTEFGPTYTKGDTVGLGWNRQTETVFFTKNGVLIGV